MLLDSKLLLAAEFVASPLSDAGSVVRVVSEVSLILSPLQLVRVQVVIIAVEEVSELAVELAWNEDPLEIRVQSARNPILIVLRLR